MSSAANYYYQHLTKQQQKVYYGMKEGLLAMASSFQVPKLEGQELAEIYFFIRMDHPEIFYSVNFSYRYYQESESVEIIPEYLFPKRKLEDHKKAMESRVKKIVRQANMASDREKLLFVHDFICQQVKYDKLKKAYSHEIIGPLGQGVGVCEGIAKTVKRLCDELGIWCIIAISEVNPEKQIKYRHAWNIVRLDGRYYHFDVTFDNTLSVETQIRYDYFAVSDAQVFKDHEPVIWNVPACEDGEYTYYREHKLSFTKYEDVRKRSAQAVKKGKTLLFHWRGGYLTRDILKELLQIFEEEAKKKERYAYVSLNWAQAVLMVRFGEKKTEETVRLEDANEGEKEGAYAHYKT